MPLPRRRVDELAVEATLGRYQILVVEGPSDARHLQHWIDELELPITIVAVSELDLDGEHGTTWGAREQVILVSQQHPMGENVRCLVDRDTEVSVAGPPSLLLTDFPALESYVLTRGVVLRLLLMLRHLDNDETDPEKRKRATEKALEDFVEVLSRYLIPLFHLRKMHLEARSERPFPTELKRFRRGDGAGIDAKKIARQVGIKSAIPDLSSVRTLEELRPYAYGHDISRAVYAIEPRIRQRHGIQNAEDLEEVLLSMTRSEDLVEFELFQELIRWGGGLASTR